MFKPKPAVDYAVSSTQDRAYVFSTDPRDIETFNRIQQTHTGSESQLVTKAREQGLHPVGITITILENGLAYVSQVRHMEPGDLIHYGSFLSRLTRVPSKQLPREIDFGNGLLLYYFSDRNACQMGKEFQKTGKTVQLFYKLNHEQGSAHEFFFQLGVTQEVQTNPLITKRTSLLIDSSGPHPRHPRADFTVSYVMPDHPGHFDLPRLDEVESLETPTHHVSAADYFSFAFNSDGRFCGITGQAGLPRKKPILHEDSFIFGAPSFITFPSNHPNPTIDHLLAPFSLHHRAQLGISQATHEESTLVEQVFGKERKEKVLLGHLDLHATIPKIMRAIREEHDDIILEDMLVFQ